MEIEPVTGTRLRFPPGRLAIRLDATHRAAYRSLYARYLTQIDDLPLLRERDFNGQPVRVTEAQLSALNRAFASLSAGADELSGGVFDRQEQVRSRLAKKMQFLS